VNFIGAEIKKHPFRAITFSFLWAISPIGSNTLFIAVGMAKTKLRWVLTGFFLGRLISYFSLAYTSKIVYEGLQEMFENQIIRWDQLIINILGLASILFYLMFDWEQFLVHRRFRINTKVFKRLKDALKKV
jgi:hypothetical protein